MGILNITPDSFSDGGLNFNQSTAVDSARRMVDEGADLLDIGGESTRPGAVEVSAEEELRRVIPVIEAIQSVGLPISVDTRKASVAKAALAAGATIVNDVSAFADPQMPEVCALAGCHVCLMHMKGEPQSMQKSPTYGDVVLEVTEYLVEKAKAAELAGIVKSRIWLDPGIGFGKTGQHNFLLLHGLEELVDLGYPVMIGVSRKSFIGAVSHASVEQRLPVTLAAQVLAQASGVRVVRAHDVSEARQAIDVAAMILRPSLFSKPLA